MVRAQSCHLQPVPILVSSAARPKGGPIGACTSSGPCTRSAPNQCWVEKVSRPSTSGLHSSQQSRGPRGGWQFPWDREGWSQFNVLGPLSASRPLAFPELVMWEKSGPKAPRQPPPLRKAAGRHSLFSSHFCCPNFWSPSTFMHAFIHSMITCEVPGTKLAVAVTQKRQTLFSSTSLSSRREN